MGIMPGSRPRASQEVVRAAAEKVWKAEKMSGPLPDMFVAGVPAYYFTTMGKPDANDRGMYDDAFFVFGPGGTFVPFNGNTDPSVFRKEIATLVCPQVVWYRPGQHAIGKRTEHAAFRQDSPVRVRRDGLIEPKGFRHDTRGISLGDGIWTDDHYPSRFWCNNHRGGSAGTSSEGCLTVPPGQWEAYHALVLREMNEAHVDRFPMVLIPGPIA